MAKIPKCALFRLCCWLCLIFFSIVTSSLVLDGVSSTESEISDKKNGTSEDDDDWVNLDDLTDAELEAICTSRGFELVTDDIIEENGRNKSGTGYTHQDYVEAAQQCLAIEKEMERVINENPGMMQQLLEEAARLEKHKEQLEKELARVQNTTAINNSQTPAFFSSSAISAINEAEDTTSESSIPFEQSLIEKPKEANTGAIQMHTALRQPFNEVRKQLLKIFKIISHMSFSAARMLRKYLQAIMGFSNSSDLKSSDASCNQ
mmetsp:Transcript_23648/g.33910  ORF Transcript_23648/g.33910 Transcript_23648/m.33910 type:complete len:262 (+) Transcript_23648:167-952(+)